MAAQLQLRVRGSGGVAAVNVEISVPADARASDVRRAAVSAAEDGRLEDGLRYRLLCAGKFLSDDRTLEEQGVRSGARLLLMPPAAGEERVEALAAKAAEGRAEATRVERLTAAALRIARREEEEGGGGGGESVTAELTDQDGRPVELPAHEIVALKTGMVLFEKGSAFLRQGEYAAARELLAESDRSFSRAAPALLESIDNFAVLQLNLCWCFLRLRDPAFLPEATTRLQRAESILERAHGQSLERLLAVRGVTGPTLVLYLRLHLLKGVVFFYNERKSAAAQSFDVARGLLQELSVDADAMASLQAMGFSERESRLGLRAATNAVEPAASHILARREKIAEMRRAEKDRIAQRRFGPTADGSPVSLEMLATLTADMGFRRSLSVAALRQTNNDLGASQALLLSENPEVLLGMGLGPSMSMRGRSRGGQNAGTVNTLDPDAVAQLVGMGFDLDVVSGTLLSCGGNVERAVELLLSDRGVVVADEETEEATETEAEPSQEGEAASADSGGGGAEDPEVAAEREKVEAQERADEEELIMELDLDDEAYLDAPLDEEASVLAEFLSALGS
jgi:UBA/TS-N domain